MRRTLPLSTIGLLFGSSTLAVFAAGLLGGFHPPSQDASGVPAILQPERCYRFGLAVMAPANYKVLARLEHGWIKAEVEAGPASDKRQPVWINTGQIITVRETRCSD